MNNQDKYPLRGTYHNPNADLYSQRVSFIFV